jgi:single-strand DNA-binding protein
VNIVYILGHLASDPESRTTATGSKIVTLRVADNQKRKNDDYTNWWKCTVWGSQFDNMMPYLKKGSCVIVTGELRTGPEIFTNKNGEAQVSNLEITVNNIQFNPFGSKSKDPDHKGTNLF